MKQQTYFEHADAQFNGELVIALMDADGQSGIYSTVLAINELQDSWPGGVPFITMERETSHVDGKLTALRLNIDIPGVKPSRVRNL